MVQEDHRIPLWGLFLALLALTAAEVGLFEVWSRHQWLMPKYAMVLLLLVFTVPKAAIVLVFFMHLKFERQLVIALALIPFLTAALAVLPTLSDIVALKQQAYNQVSGLGEYTPVDHRGEHGGSGQTDQRAQEAH